MNFEDEFAYIFGAVIDGNDLVVRLDRKESLFYESFKDGVTQIGLINCLNIEKALDFFEKNQGEFIWNYEHLENENRIAILMDDGTAFRVGSSRIEETVDDLTIEEADMKMKYLVSAYHRESESSRKVGASFSDWISF